MRSNYNSAMFTWHLMLCSSKVCFLIWFFCVQNCNFFFHSFQQLQHTADFFSATFLINFTVRGDILLDPPQTIKNLFWYWSSFDTGPALKDEKCLLDKFPLAKEYCINVLTFPIKTLPIYFFHVLADAGYWVRAYSRIGTSLNTII